MHAHALWQFGTGAGSPCLKTGSASGSTSQHAQEYALTHVAVRGQNKEAVTSGAVGPGLGAGCLGAGRQGFNCYVGCQKGSLADVSCQHVELVSGSFDECRKGFWQKSVA